MANIPLSNSGGFQEKKKEKRRASFPEPWGSYWEPAQSSPQPLPPCDPMSAVLSSRASPWDPSQLLTKSQSSAATSPFPVLSASLLVWDVLLTLWFSVSLALSLGLSHPPRVSPPPSVFIYSVISISRCGLIYTYLHFGLSSRAALFILLFKSFQLCCFRCVPLTCPLLSCHFPCLCHYKMHFPCSTISREHWLLLQESGVEKPRLAGG